MKILIFSITMLGLALISCAHSDKVKVNSDEQNKIESTEIVNPSFYQEKFLNGIDFFARGNEPNWVLEIDFEKSMRFSEMNGIEINTPAVEGVKAQDSDVTNFRAVTESIELSVTISKELCQDNMSGELFDYNVRVRFRNSNQPEFVEFSGCGKYLYDYRLNDIWVMEEMTGVELKKENLLKGLPMFEFNLSEKRFGGHAGCNQISGGFDLKGNKITFGNLISTKMACPDMTVEQKILQVLNNKKFIYRIENLKLVLESDSGIKMIFKKVD